MGKQFRRSLRRVIIESIMILVFFAAIGIWQWKSTGHLFFLFNFGYIGLAGAAGSFFWDILPREKKIWGRRISQLMIGIYMIGLLGFLGRENMQIEGFFVYLLAGIFSGATLHYFIAKIAGPFIFGRAWCGWACWTAMVLDFLPWTRNPRGRIRNLGILRTTHFVLSLVLILFLWFVIRRRNMYAEDGELIWMIIGNAVYYTLAILMAVILKDNRAFCKYLCPIPVLMKIGSRFSLIKIKIDNDLCTQCGLCERHCPMDIRLLAYSQKGKRILSQECILCQNCINVCPVGAMSATMSLDAGFREKLRFRHSGEP